MSQKKEFDDIFDDDFEVTYEEDPVYDEDDFDNGKFYETDDSDEDDSEENYFEEEYPGDEYPDEGAENEYDDAIYSPSDRKRKKRHPSEEEPEYETGKRSDPRSRKRSGVPLAAPIKKGGKALSRLTGFLLQQPHSHSQELCPGELSAGVKRTISNTVDQPGFLHFTDRAIGPVGIWNVPERCGRGRRQQRQGGRDGYHEAQRPTNQHSHRRCSGTTAKNTRSSLPQLIRLWRCPMGQ